MKRLWFAQELIFQLIVSMCNQIQLVMQQVQTSEHFQSIQPFKYYEISTEVKVFQPNHPAISVFFCKKEKQATTKWLIFQYHVAKYIQPRLAQLNQLVQKYQGFNQGNLKLHSCEVDQSFSKIRLIRTFNNQNRLDKVLAAQIDGSQLLEYLKSLAISLLSLHEVGLTHNLIRAQTVIEKGKNTLALDLPCLNVIGRYWRDRDRYFSEENIYCAPEVRLNEQFSKEGDIYALGVVFLQIYHSKLIYVRQVQILLKEVKDDFLRELFGAMLDPNPVNRPNINNVSSSLQLEKVSFKKRVDPPFWDQSIVSIYKRRLLGVEKHPEVQQVKFKKQEVFEQQKSKILVKMLNKNAIRLNIKLKLSQSQQLTFNIIQTDQTIKSASENITSVQEFYSLFEQQHIKSFQVTNQGFVEIFVKNHKLFQLKIKTFKEGLAELKFTDLAIQYSQNYRDFQRYSNKLKNASLNAVQKQQIMQPQYFWPKVIQQFIEKQLYVEAIKLSKFVISRYPQVKYQFKGLGCLLETKGLKVKQIVNYYKEVAGKTKNPYDQLAICGIIINNYLPNYNFLKEIHQKSPQNQAVIYSLGSIQFNQQNFQIAAEHFKKVTELGDQTKRAQVLRLLCIYKLKKRLSETQLDLISRLSNQASEKIDFSGLLVELLYLADRSNKEGQLIIKQRLNQTVERVTQYHKQLLFFMFGSLVEETKNLDLALFAYKVFSKFNPQYLPVYRIIAELNAMLFEEDLSLPLSEYIDWHNKFIKEKNQQIYSVKTVVQDKQFALVDILSKKFSGLAQQGSKYFKQGDYLKAIYYFQQCLQEYDDEPSIHYNLAIAYRRSGIYDQALKYIQKTIELKPESSKAHYIMGLIYQDLVNDEKAVVCFRKAYEIKPHKSSTSKLLLDSDANCNFKEGLKYIEKMIELQPEKSEHYEKKAHMLFANCQQQKAQLLMQFAQQHLAQPKSKIKKK